MVTSPLLSNVRHRAMITPVGPLLTRLIYIIPSCWTICRSFEIHLEMETFSWFGLQIQCSIPGVPNLGCMYPWGYICLSEWVHLRLAIEGKNIFACCLFSNLYAYIT